MADRFEEIVTALAADRREGRARRLPVVSDAQGAVIARGVHQELDRAHAGRDAHAAAVGAAIACSRGCAACCETVVVSYQPEAAAVVAWLATADGAAARRGFLAAYPEWRRRVGDGADRVVELARAGRIEESEAAFFALRRRRVACPFLDADRVCSIYPVRPLACRHTHALDTAEHCVAGDADAPRPRVLGYAPTDETVAECSQLLRFAHGRMVDPGEPARPLADVVHAMLTAPAAPRRIGRNDPCPCGSGDKFKRCCGA